MHFTYLVLSGIATTPHDECSYLCPTNTRWIIVQLFSLVTKYIAYSASTNPSLPTLHKNQPRTNQRTKPNKTQHDHPPPIKTAARKTTHQHSCSSPHLPPHSTSHSASPSSSPSPYSSPHSHTSSKPDPQHQKRQAAPTHWRRTQRCWRKWNKSSFARYRLCCLRGRRLYNCSVSTQHLVLDCLQVKLVCGKDVFGIWDGDTRGGFGRNGVEACAERRNVSPSIMAPLLTCL